MTTEIPAIFDLPDVAFVLLPTGAKYPPIEKEWQKNPHTFAEAAANKGNVGVMAGNGYIGLDEDEPDAFQGLELPISTTWETRPGRLGMRFKCVDVASEILATYGKKSDLSQFKLFKFGNAVGEIKLQRTYQVIPPSHKFIDPVTGDDVQPGKGDRVEYRMLDSSPPATITLAWLLAELQRIGITFSSRLDTNAAKLEGMAKEARQRCAESDEKKARRYAEAALRDEALILAGTPNGNRNVQLNTSAFKMGQFVAAGALLEADVISELSKAAENTGLETEEIRVTIISGMEAGAQHPREIPKASYKEKRDGEAAKKAAIELEDVADIEYDKNDKIKKIRFSPTFAARAVLEKMPLVMAEDSEDIYRFNGQIYRPDGARIIDQVLCDVAGDSVTGDKLREVMRRIKNELLDSPVVFEPDPYLLAVKNGVADLHTGEVREYEAEDLLLEQLEVNHVAGARCPVFLAFLESITPNVSDRLTLIDWFVATAIKEPLAYVLFLLGLGRNGKGIYEKLIKKFFGQVAFRDMPLAEVSRNNFAASGFYRKRGWIASETGKKKASIGTDFMKLVSGNGVIDGDRKNKSRIQFEPYFQVIVDTNTMPKIEDNSIGWMERFVKVDLPYIFVVEPDPKNSLERQRDPALYAKLTIPSELSGILNLLLFRSPAITESMAITKRAGSEMFAEYNEQSSSVTTFFEMFCEYECTLSNLWTPSEPIYEAYRTWCGFKVGEVIDIRYFGRQLKKFCGGFDSKRGKDKTRKNTTMYKGLIFAENKYQAELDALKLSMSQGVSVVSQSNINEEEETKSQYISMSQLSQSELWNEILKRFGDPSEPKTEDDFLSKRKDANLTDLSEITETSKAIELFSGELIRETSEIARDKSKIPTETKKAGDAPLITCAKCGEDLTGHGQITKGDKVYCAKVGCGYSFRGETEI